jgi:hypothetical protein
MQAANRHANLQREKAIGRIACSHVRWKDIEANISIDGEEKQLHELKENGIEIKLAAPSGRTLISTKLRDLGFASVARSTC